MKGKGRRAFGYVLSMTTNFKKRAIGTILSKDSQREVCQTVSSDINDWLVGMSDFSVDILPEMGCDSGDISLHDGSKSDRDSDYNPEPSKTAELQLQFVQEIIIIKLTIFLNSDWHMLHEKLNLFMFASVVNT